MNRLGRLTPPDDDHIVKYPLRALARTEWPTGVPVVLGINWYDSMFEPVRSSTGRYYIKDGSGSLAGGHAICVKGPKPDYFSWWDFYNQRDTGECVGYSTSRMMSLLNRVKYDAPWLYFETQDDAGQPRDPQSGTFVRNAGSVLVREGHKTPAQSAPRPGQGISVYRWAQSVDDIHHVIADPDADRLGAVPLLNSWGKDWPHKVWLRDELLDRLVFAEDGECMVVTDR